MWSYLLKRLLLMIPTLFGILLITFVVIQFVPGGPVEQLVYQLEGREGGMEGGGGTAPAPGIGGYRGRQGVDAAQIEEIRKLYGFDKPAHERFVQMIGQFARFDLGTSFFHNKKVSQLIAEKLPVSISLGLWTFLLTYLISVPLGIAKAVRAGTAFDTATTFIVLLGYAIPGFVLGVVLLETLFSLDGLGLLSYESVIRRDYPVVFGSLFVFTIIGLITNLIRDLCYVWVDPRVKYFD